MNQYIIVDLLNLLYTDFDINDTNNSNSKIILSNSEIEWGSAAQSKILTSNDRNIQLILKRIKNTEQVFSVFQQRAWTIIEKQIRSSNRVQQTSYIYVIKCRSKKQDECIQWYLFFFYVLQHTFLKDQKVKVTFVIGNNDAVPCDAVNRKDTSNSTYCSSPNSSSICNHSACGLDDYLIILIYSLLYHVVLFPEEEIKVISKDQYRDFEQIVEFFSQYQKEFLQTVRFISRCHIIPFIDQIANLKSEDLMKPLSTAV